MTPYDKNGEMRELKIMGGKPRTFDSTFALALVLMHLRCKGSANLLQMVFGATRSPLSLWLCFF